MPSSVPLLPLSSCVTLGKYYTSPCLSILIYKMRIAVSNGAAKNYVWIFPYDVMKILANPVLYIATESIK